MLARFVAIGQPGAPAATDLALGGGGVVADDQAFT